MHAPKWRKTTAGAAELGNNAATDSMAKSSWRKMARPRGRHSRRSSGCARTYSATKTLASVGVTVKRRASSKTKRSGHEERSTERGSGHAATRCEREDEAGCKMGVPKRGIRS